MQQKLKHLFRQRCMLSYEVMPHIVLRVNMYENTFELSKTTLCFLF